MLVCDDEPQIIRALQVILRGAGYAVSAAGTLAQARELLEREPPDGAIVDLLLPDGNGLELCAELRSWSTMPIIVVSAIDEEAQKVKALETGADDYIVKPFAVRELLARLDARFRRVNAEQAGEAGITVQGLEIDFAGHSVRRDGREVKLTPTEFELLSVLAHNRGRVMTSRTLLAEVWGAAHPNDAPLLRAHIANLRRKIEDDAQAWRYIKTVPGIGYRFCD